MSGFLEYVCANLATPWQQSIRVCNSISRVAVLDIMDGTSKVPLAEAIAATIGARIVHFDELFYTEDWQHRTPEEVLAQARDQLPTDGAWVFVASTRPEFTAVMEQVVQPRVDITVGLPLTQNVTYYKKAFRSIWRALGLARQGAAVETLSSVRRMLEKVASDRFETNETLFNYVMASAENNVLLEDALCATWTVVVVDAAEDTSDYEVEAEAEAEDEADADADADADEADADDADVSEALSEALSETLSEVMSDDDDHNNMCPEIFVSEADVAV